MKDSSSNTLNSDCLTIFMCACSSSFLSLSCRCWRLVWFCRSSNETFYTTEYKNGLQMFESESFQLPSLIRNIQTNTRDAPIPVFYFRYQYSVFSIGRYRVPIRYCRYRVLIRYWTTAAAVIPASRVFGLCYIYQTYLTGVHTCV